MRVPLDLNKREFSPYLHNSSLNHTGEQVCVMQTVCVRGFESEACQAFEARIESSNPLVWIMSSDHRLRGSIG